MVQICKVEKGCCGLDADSLPFKIFKALCDPSRAAVLANVALAGRPITVSRAAEGMAVDVSVVSRHLAALRESGILKSQKKGREVFYRLDSKGVAGRLRALAGALEACCPGAGKSKPSTRKKAK